MTPPRSPYGDMEIILAKSAGAFERVINAMARAAAKQDPVAMQRAEADAAAVFGRTLSYSDLLGRRRMELLQRAASDRAEKAERARIVAAESDAFANSYHFEAVPMGGVLPRIEFTQAVDDIARRMPTVVRGWLQVAELYATKHAFALSKSMSETVTRRVQDVMTRAVAGGDGAPENPVQEIADIGGWSRGYAATVYETNAQTAYTAGVWARASDPDVLAVIPGFEFFSAHLPTSRPNHEAIEGLIAPTGSSLWNTYSPPAGFRCACGLLEVTVYEAERQGLIRNGKMISLLPPGLGIRGYPDKGFGLGRPDRLALSGNFTNS